MHQTFYIDIDEEITSVVDRLRHAKTKEIIMVVPKRALLIQSIVNLRILKKEADEAGFQMMMVTQDKLGKILIEKAGIFVQQKMDNISDEEIDLQKENQVNSRDDYKIKNRSFEPKKEKSRLDEIGSNSYFDEIESGEKSKIDYEKIKKEKAAISGKSEEKEELVNKELVRGIVSNINKEPRVADADLQFRPSPVKVPVSGFSSTNGIRPTAGQAFSDMNFKKGSPRQNFQRNIPAPVPEPEIHPQDKKIENFFYQPGNSGKRFEKAQKEAPRDFKLSSKIHKWFWIFGIISAALVLAILAYLFIPKADLAITVKTQTKDIDSEVTGDINVKSADFDKGVIPAKIITAEAEVSKDIEASGSKSVSNQKAHGTITIYNEFDSNPQPLVATTRFLAENGKLFRLIKGVTVPGMSSDGKPGTIEVQVAADQSGEEYNIEPTKFKIPGFESSGGDKYNKFYAQSKEAMAGGGQGTAQSNFITEGDVSSARGKIAGDLESAIKQKIQEASGNEFLVVDGAMSEEEAVYKLSNSAGDVANSFKITASVKAKALVVNKNDLNDIVAQMIAKAGNGQKDIDNSSLKLDFGKSNVDFDKGTIDIKFKAEGKISPNINIDTVKSEILGKNENDLKNYLGTYSDIEKAEVNYWPSFLNSRIPFRSKRVNVTLDKQ